MTDCEHNYTYLGIRYHDGSRPLPGTGARQRYYAHVYFCTKCLNKQSDKVDVVHQTTYDAIGFGASPGSADECKVPEYDR